MKKKISATLDVDVVVDLMHVAERQGTNLSAVLNRAAREYLSPGVKLANAIAQHPNKYVTPHSADDIAVIVKAFEHALGIEFKRTPPKNQRVKSGNHTKAVDV